MVEDLTRRVVPTALTEERDSPEVPATSVSQTWWWAAAGVSTVFLFVVNVIVSRTAVAPRTPWDEVGVLQMARIIAGRGPVTEMSGSGYYPGWSIVMAPIWWFTDDPEVVYRAAIWMVIVLAMLTIWPLTLIARRVGLTTPQAITVAALALTLPARTVHADYVLSENLLTLLMMWVVVAAFVVWDRPSPLTMTMFVVAVGAAYLTHARAIAVVLTAAVWLVCYVRRDARYAALGLGLLGATVFAVRWFANRITDEILLSGFGKGDLMSTALSTTTPALMGRVTFSQGWAQLVGSFGVVAIGVVVLVVWVLRELRERHVGPAGFMFGLSAATFAVSIMWWSGARFLVDEDSRFDVWVYTRYIDPVALLLIVIALTAIVRKVDFRVVLTALAASVVVITPVITLIAPHVPTFGSMHGPGNAAGILHWAEILPTNEPYERPLLPTFTNENSFWMWASLSVIVALVSVLALRRRPRVAIGALFVTFVAAGWYGNPDQLRDSPDTFVEAVEAIEETTGAETGSLPIDFDQMCPSPGWTHAQTLNWSGYWMSPRDVEVVVRDVDAPIEAQADDYRADVVIACADWEEAGDFGALPVLDSEYTTYRLWVLPGDLQDELGDSNLLGDPPIDDEDLS